MFRADNMSKGEAKGNIHGRPEGNGVSELGKGHCYLTFFFVHAAGMWDLSSPTNPFRLQGRLTV